MLHSAMKITTLSVTLVVLVVSLAAETTAQQDCTALAYAGDCNFYHCLSRKFGCSNSDYPVGYGFKYCTEFEEKKGCFNARGQRWIRNVRRCLMRDIIKSNVYRNPSSTCEEIKTFAFNSHPRCYVDNGFCSDVLPDQKNCLREVIGIFNVLTSWSAIKQVAQTFKMCFSGDNGVQQVRTISESNTSEFMNTLIYIYHLITNSCPSSGLDIIFVFDASESIGADNFDTMKTFVTDILADFDIGSDSTRVGVIRYDSTASVVIPLGSINNHTQLNVSISDISYTNGSSANIQSALNLLISAFANARVNEGIPRVAIVFTDGQSNSNSLSSTVEAAQAVQAAGITTFSFGIGSDVDINELNAITSQSGIVDDVFLSNFSSSTFAIELQSLRTSVCTTPAKTTFGSRLEGKLGLGHVRLLQYEFPDEGMTLAVRIAEGNLLIRGSFNIPVPTALTEDFSIQSTNSSDINYFISPELYERSVNLTSGNVTDRRKRQLDPELNGRNLYVSVIGLMSKNSFSMNATFGNTVPSSSALKMCSIPLVILLLALQKICN